MNQLKNCQDCHLPIQGRTDKKFCNDQCRNNYNNERNADSPTVRQTNRILRKNRRILEGLNPTGKTKVFKKKLIGEGFDFEYVTRLYKTQNNRIYHFCYEYGYTELQENELLLVKKVL